MKTQLNKITSSNTWSSNAQIINTYINQYKIQNSSPVIDDADCFDQAGNIFEEHQHTSFNSD